MYPSAYLRTCSSFRRQRNQRNHICSSPHLFTNLEKWEWVWNFYFLSKIPEETSENYSCIFDSLENSFKISLSPHKRWEKKIPFSFSSWKLRILEGTWENISIFKGNEYETLTFYQKYDEIDDEIDDESDDENDDERYDGIDDESDDERRPST